MASTPNLVRFLGLRRDLVWILLAMMVIGLGEELWIRFVPKYLDVLGGGALVIGLYDALKTLLGAVYAYPGGALTDRLGHRASLAIFTLLSLAGYLLVYFVTHWAAVLVGMFFFLAWSSFSLPASFSLVAGRLTQNKYAMGIGVQGIVKRLPILVGPVLGGVLIGRYGVVEGIRVGLLVSVATGLVALAFQLRIGESISATYQKISFFDVLGKFPPTLRNLLVSDILIRFCERIPYSFVVLYVLDDVGASAVQFGTLTTIEMLAAIVCFVPTAYLSDRYGRYGFVIVTFVFFTLFPLVLLFSHSFKMLVVAFVIRGLKEFGETARKALILEQTSDGTRSRTVGAYYLIRDVTVSFGSLAGAVIYREVSPQANFLVAAAVGLVGTVYFAWKGRS
ncbi:MAG: MFS transporter [Acidobacteriota bacterium]